MFMLGLPFIASLATFGLAGLGIVLVEALGLHQRESVSWIQAFWTSVWANLFSTFMGLIFTFMYAASGFLILLIINVVLLSWFLSRLLLRVLAELRGNVQLLLLQALTYLISFIVSLAIFITGGILNFGIGIKTRMLIEPGSFTLNVYVTAVLGLLALNFLLTWILESYWLTGKWKEKSPAKLCRTVFWINVRSYVYILLPIVILGGILQRKL
ncbi:hypothetical protein DO97_19560 [Neosynechococcus sphagnicola sy1]|uniref:Uncharacterized protein n=2 Tax=Neosynechococcus TaxID=1501143 RepID=A0A098THD7_9CYAN|nr:hypothetical protein DO97_19560 [Neosynechococcus sphagnicola sy1]